MKKNLKSNLIKQPDFKIPILLI